MADAPRPPRIPRNRDDDYTAEMAADRARFAAAQTGAPLDHVTKGTIDPALLKGNCENFFGVAQVPIGLAGPLEIDGEHAKGPFYIPLATTEGTLVASYNRGMRLLSEVGGVKTTVIERYMQRAPVFHFANARDARAFGEWVADHEADIRTAAEATTTVGQLHHIQRFQVAQMCFLRFNYLTGDAAGQNMSGKATYAACEWIAEHAPGQPWYTLSGAIDTDKKHSHMNMLHSRGARVVAEVTIPDAVMQAMMGPSNAKLFRGRLVSNAGGMLAGTVNNGMHAANGLTALFIATGQDVANISESHAAITFVELLPNGDYYWSITIPSLIVATYGGGTGLPTQRECLEMLGCYGKGKVEKFAEICAATVLAGEISLAAAVQHGDWVSSHDRYGRNRP
ncbi:hydroxymethylglutaryl-CoA reductase (NADPH) 1 [Parvularcula bermudensis HTCC2503]|uniref:hydroxymethylglutaryl-CoA reductase (NADPH) n=1 Tax=Parvularcula bermudensis (strain ATCC BAA-594 / HTCC2503 / KCTC 12087) TaxID=314260 RepID=E0TCL1_PARBH|nr:hydroxymethylglutaryl-CoA reductase [Parvularcula bermudensis]ADM08600.1 hydroxymethylglutaryl-CoA reductase (NADPH) 1 [Parvularcula bermudensis HTCC2503]